MVKTTLLPAWTLLLREFVRFFRQRNRVVGAFLTPILFWLLMGFGFKASFKMPGLVGEGNLSALEYLFPGTIVMVLLFTAIFSTISIIEDRKAGFLQGVLVSPASRVGMVLGKILGGTALATIQGLLFLLIAPFLGIQITLTSFFLILLAMLGVSFALTGLGFVIAWRMSSIQGFHAIMNLFLMPLWFLSGSLFPMEGAPAALKIAMTLNPLTYGVSLLRQCFYQDAHLYFRDLPALTLSIGVTILFGGATFCLSILSARKVTRGDLKS